MLIRLAQTWALAGDDYMGLRLGGFLKTLYKTGSQALAELLWLLSTSGSQLNFNRQNLKITKGWLINCLEVNIRLRPDAEIEQISI